ncbi:MAG: hypothetical protein HWN65_09250 [Candidatus Helarchaeota archaeon]|nr:hypothetical protein [Candidatus Helarchaeota archaeon]
MKWKTELNEIAGNIPFMIIRNKLDLQPRRQVPTGDALKMSSALGSLSFFSSSSGWNSHSPIVARLPLSLMNLAFHILYMLN